MCRIKSVFGFGAALFCAALAMAGSAKAAAGPTADAHAVTPQGAPVWESHHDGVGEIGYTWPVASGVTHGEHIELFTPRSYPVAFRKVRVHWAQDGTDTTLNYSIVFYEDVNGQPGALLGEQHEVAGNVPNLLDPPEVYEVDVSQMGISLQEGSIFIGVLWDTVAEQSFYILADTSPTTVKNRALMRDSPSGAWTETASVFPQHRGYMLEAGSEEPDRVPLPWAPLALCVAGAGLWALRRRSLAKRRMGAVLLSVLLCASASAWAAPVAVKIPASAKAGAPRTAVSTIPGEGVPVWESHHDGKAESYYNWGTGTSVTAGEFIELFTPRAYPMVFRTARVYWAGTGPDTDLDFDVVFYENVSGQPGSLIAEIAATATNVPGYGSPAPYDVDVSSLGISLQEGSVFIGVRWNPSVEVGFAAPVDETPTTVGNLGFIRNGPGQSWTGIGGSFVGYRGFLWEAGSEEPNPVPLPWGALAGAFAVLGAWRVRSA